MIESTIAVENPYLPLSVKLEEVIEEVHGPRAIKRFKVNKLFDYAPGQCAMLSAFGYGEVMIAISSSPSRKFLEFGVLKMGLVTNALHNLNEGDYIGVRGPLGNGFPVEDWKHRNLLFIGGGIGITPLRSIVHYAVDHRHEFDKLDLIYGARTSDDLCYKKDLEELEKRDDIDVHLSIDVEEDGWRGYTGFVPSNVLEVAPSPENTTVITCGPPIMIKYVIQNLLKLEFADEQIFTTVERRMKCGVGMCGRCNIGNLYVCKDGPVFSYDVLKKYPEAFESDDL